MSPTMVSTMRRSFALVLVIGLMAAGARVRAVFDDANAIYRVFLTGHLQSLPG
jgi:hypothetical protein